MSQNYKSLLSVDKLFINNVQLTFWATLYMGDCGEDGTAGKFCLPSPKV